MPSTKSLHPVHSMSIDAAYECAAGLIEEEARGASDLEPALYRLEQRYGISPHQILHLARKRAKKCDLGLFARMKAAYLDTCQRQVARLQHVIAITEATTNDDFADLAAEAAALAAKVAARQAALRLAASNAESGE